MPAKAGIQGSGGALYSGGIHTLHRPPWRGHRTLPSTLSARPPQPTVIPAKAGIQGSGGALYSGGIHTLHRPPWRGHYSADVMPAKAGIQGRGGALVSGGIHTLPSTPSWRPPQPTVMPAKAGIQGLAGHSSREVSTPSVNLLGEASIPPVNLLGEASISCLRPLRGGRHSLPSCPRRRASSGLAGHSSREASTPSIDLPGEATVPCHQPFRRGRHSLPSCPRRRESRGPEGQSSREASTPCRPPPWRGHPYPAVHLLGEAATAYRHAREGGHPGSGGALLSGGIHTLPSTPSWRPPQPTVMPAKAGIQGLAGHSSREVSTPSVNLLGEASIPPVNLLGEASISCLRPLRGGRHSLPSCPRRRASNGLGGTHLGRQQSSRSGTL